MGAGYRPDRQCTHFETVRLLAPPVASADAVGVTHPWELPPLDHTLSPHTGYTRAHWLAVADGLLEAAGRHASPSGSLISPPGRPSFSGVASDGLEGFARTFLLAAFRVAGERGGDPAGLLQRYAAGLASGVTRGHAEAWPRIEQPVRQALVEAASVAIGLHLTRAWLWDGLDAATQERAVEWLSGDAGAGGGGVWTLEIPDNNWHLFRVVVGEFLASVGAPHDREVMDSDLARVEEFWVGDGWYRDGKLGPDGPVGDAFDHYCGWAMHTYPVLIDRITGPRASTPQAHERLHRFLADYVHLVGADGGPLHQGRSLIYRFAAAAAPWMGALAGSTPLSPGRTRRLASGMLRHFVEQGFTDGEGVPTLGWYGEFLPMVQGYSGPASPFWLAKGFAGLLLPADHPCWTEQEEPLPSESGDHRLALPAPGWLVTSRASDGIVQVANHGSDDQPPLAGVDDPHYSRLAYSTVTGPVLGADDLVGAADNHLGLFDPARGLTRRTRIHRIGVTDEWAGSWHEPVWPDGAVTGARITNLSIPLGEWEVRVHLVDGAPLGTVLREFGWQLAGSEEPAVLGASGGSGVEAGSLRSWLVPVTAGTTDVLRTTGTSAFGERSATPFVESSVESVRHVQVTLVALGRDLPDPPTVTWAVEGSGAEPVVELVVDGAVQQLALSSAR